MTYLSLKMNKTLQNANSIKLHLFIRLCYFITANVFRTVPRQGQYINISLPVPWHAQNFLFETIKPSFHSRRKHKRKHWHGRLTSTWKRPWRRHTHKRRQEDHLFFVFFLMLALMLALALQPVKTKYHSGTTQAQGYLTARPGVLVTENTGSRFSRA